MAGFLCEIVEDLRWFSWLPISHPVDGLLFGHQQLQFGLGVVEQLLGFVNGKWTDLFVHGENNKDIVAIAWIKWVCFGTWISLAWKLWPKIIQNHLVTAQVFTARCCLQGWSMPTGTCLTKTKRYVQGSGNFFSSLLNPGDVSPQKKSFRWVHVKICWPKDPSTWNMEDMDVIPLEPSANIFCSFISSSYQLVAGAPQPSFWGCNNLEKSERFHGRGSNLPIDSY